MRIKNWKNKIMMFLLAGVMVFSMTACQSAEESAVKETVNNFETACKQMDGNGMLDCIDPDIADPLRAGGDFLSMLGVNVDELVNSAASLVFGQDYADSGFLKSLDLKVSKVEVAEDGTSAVATGKLSCTWEGEKLTQEAEVVLTYKNDDSHNGWYITDIRL